MRMANMALIITAVLSVGVMHGHGQGKVNIPADSTLLRMMKENHLPAMGVGVIEDNKIVYTKVLGELKAGVPAPQNTLFQVASLTKPVVEMTTLRLVSKGLWRLDAPLYNYWTDPDVEADPRSKVLTTRHVITHQTGFLNWRWMDSTGKLRFTFDPGTKTNYSGEGMEYLRKALEKKFGMPLQDIVKQYLFEPEGISDMHFFWDQQVQESRFASAHQKDGKMLELRTYNSASAADLLMTTVQDYTKFALSVLQQHGISDKVWQDMITKQSARPGDRFGLGWEVFQFANGEYALLHTGADPGVKTLCVIFPKSKRGLVMLTNGDSGFDVMIPVISKALAEGDELIRMGK